MQDLGLIVKSRIGAQGLKHDSDIQLCAADALIDVF